MKKIIIGFVDFWTGFDPLNNVFYRLLSKSYDVVVSSSKDEVEYLFYSAFGYEFLNYHCIRIFISGENLCPNYNLCDYGVGFEHMEFEDRFYRFPNFFYDHYVPDHKKIRGDRRKLYGGNPEKRKFCGIVVSNNNFADPYRENFFNELSRYRRVDSGGRAFNNIGKPGGVEDKLAFLNNYKFSIAFENSSYPGYCTEKLLQAFSAGTVPIYWGDATAKEMFNEKAYIDCTGMRIEDAIARIKEIDGNDELYRAMLSEIILVDRDMEKKYVDGLEKWLNNIVEQPYDMARRVPVHGKMSVYEENYRKKARMEEMIKKHKRLYSIGKKITGSRL